MGFNVDFGMVDWRGRVVGRGRGGPIMITDDHKTVNALRSVGGSAGTGGGEDVDWQGIGGQAGQFGGVLAAAASSSSVGTGVGEGKAPSKRKHPKEPGHQLKKRSKPYDAPTRQNSSNSAKVSRDASEVSLSSVVSGAGTGTGAGDSTRESTPGLYFGLDGTGVGTGAGTFGGTIGEGADQLAEAHLATTQQQQQQHYIPASPHQQHHAHQNLLLPSQVPLPYMFFDPTSPPHHQPPLPLPAPKIHRLIPSQGPTYGGIEVTVLGAHFHAPNPNQPEAGDLRCVFGGTVASSTQRWSDNTLVCVLPPRAQSGVVGVWFDGVGEDNGEGGDGDGEMPYLFTYTDESDRALYVLLLFPFPLSFGAADHIFLE
jgi:hypothetical protein